jgi:hypothetical protein
MNNMSSFVPALLIPALALLGRVVIEGLFANRPRSYTLVFESGERDRIRVETGASYAAVAAELAALGAYETAIARTLTAIKARTAAMTLREGGAGEFIVGVAGRRYAVDIKNTAEILTHKQVARYFKALPDLDKRIVVARESLSEKVLARLAPDIDIGRLVVLHIPDPSNAETVLAQALGVSENMATPSRSLAH